MELELVDLKREDLAVHHHHQLMYLVEHVVQGGEAEEVIVYAPDRPKRATRPPVLSQSDPGLIKKGSKRSKK